MNKKWHRIIGLTVAVVIWAISFFTEFFSTGWQWIDLFYAILAISCGYMFCDLDLQVGFLRHRDALTHSALVPVLCFFIFHSLAAGFFSVMVAVHLFADIDIGELKGTGQIHIARVGIGWNDEVRSTFSKAFLFCNGLLALFLGICMIWFRIPLLMWW